MFCNGYMYFCNVLYIRAFIFCYTCLIYCPLVPVKQHMYCLIMYILGILYFKQYFVFASCGFHVILQYVKEVQFIR